MLPGCRIFAFDKTWTPTKHYCFKCGKSPCDEGIKPRQKLFSLMNDRCLASQPNARNRHQHKQRPQAEPEPAAFRFGFDHGGTPRGG